MEAKYELTDIRNEDGFYRIRSLRNFGNVKCGDLGGFVENKFNLDHHGNCWIFYDAVVSGDARVLNDALVYDKAQIAGNAIVGDNAKIFGNAQVYVRAQIFGSAQVYGNAQVFGNACVSWDAKIYENALVYGTASVLGLGVVRHRQTFNSGRLEVEADGWETRGDSRGYDFLAAWRDGKIVSITAGCRNWNSMEEAREHFTENYKSNGNVVECLAILEFFNRASKKNLTSDE